MQGRGNNLALLYEGLRASDTLIAKAIGVSPQAQSAKLEVRLREYITAEWDRLADQATKMAAGLIANGKGKEVLPGDVERALAVVDRTMSQWAPKVTPVFTKEQQAAYMLGRESGLQRSLGLRREIRPYNTPSASPDIKLVEKAENLLGTVKPSFDLVDRSTVAALQKHQVFWIGEFWDEKVSGQVASAAKEQVTAGMGRVAAGKVMAKAVKENLANVSVPSGFSGPTNQYFEGLVANATTVSRTSGHLRSFSKVGFTIYTIVNPSDHRTCEICELMNGKEFRTEDGVKLVGKLTNMKSPLSVKKVHPWLTPTSARQLAGKKGPASPDQTTALSKAGHSMPAFHFRCRCDIDVARSAEVIPFERVPDVKPVAGKLKSPDGKTWTHKPAVEKPVEAAAKPLTAEEAARTIRNVPFEAAVAKQYADKMAAGWKKGPGKLRKPLRDFMREEYGIQRKDWGRKSAMAVGELESDTLAVHHWDGSVTVRKDIADTVARSLKEISERRRVLSYSDYRGIHTLIHEELHGLSRFTSRAYSEGGAVVEEVTVELTARRIMRDLLGDVKTGAQSFNRPMRNAANTRWFSGGSYGSDISKFLDTVTNKTGWPEEQVIENVEKAGILMRGKLAPAYNKQSPKQHIEAFLKSMPDYDKLPPKQQKSLGNSIYKLELRRLAKRRR